MKTRLKTRYYVLMMGNDTPVLAKILFDKGFRLRPYFERSPAGEKPKYAKRCWKNFAVLGWVRNSRATNHGWGSV